MLSTETKSNHSAMNQNLMQDLANKWTLTFRTKCFHHIMAQNLLYNRRKSEILVANQNVIML